MLLSKPFGVVVITDWSLFEIPERNEPNMFLVLPPCVPVRTTDPCPYKVGDKQRSLLSTTLPSWTQDELGKGYVLPISSFYPSEHTLSIRNVTAAC